MNINIYSKKEGLCIKLHKITLIYQCKRNLIFRKTVTNI